MQLPNMTGGKIEPTMAVVVGVESHSGGSGDHRHGGYTVENHSHHSGSNSSDSKLVTPTMVMIEPSSSSVRSGMSTYATDAATRAQPITDCHTAVDSAMSTLTLGTHVTLQSNRSITGIGAGMSYQEDQLTVDSQQQLHHPQHLQQQQRQPSVLVVLLLVDQVSRQFELLRLNFFHPSSVQVADILSHVPTSVQQPGIRQQYYLGVCDPFNMTSSTQSNNGGSSSRHRHRNRHRPSALLDPDAYLSDLISNRSGSVGGSDSQSAIHNEAHDTSRTVLLLVALPEGLTVETCVRQGRLIYRHSRVARLLQSSGVPLPEPSRGSSHRTSVGADEQTTAAETVSSGATVSTRTMPSTVAGTAATSIGNSNNTTGASPMVRRVYTEALLVPQVDSDSEKEDEPSMPLPRSESRPAISTQQESVSSGTNGAQHPSYFNEGVKRNTAPIETPESSAMLDAMEAPRIPNFALNNDCMLVKPKMSVFNQDSENRQLASQDHIPQLLGNHTAQHQLLGSRPLHSSTLNNMIVEEDEEDLEEKEENATEIEPPRDLLQRHDQGFNHGSTNESQNHREKENSVHSRGQSCHSRGQSCHSRGQSAHSRGLSSVASSKGTISCCSTTDGSSIGGGSSVGTGSKGTSKKHKKSSRSKKRKKRFTSIPLSVGGLAKLADSNVVNKSGPSPSSNLSGPGSLDYRAVEADIIKFIQEDLFKKGPALIRLASHSALTYKKLVKKRKNASASGGATRRTRTFPEELRSQHGCMGASELTVAKWMEPIRQRYAEEGLSFADFYTLAGVIAIKQLGGPVIPWRGGRVDSEDGENTSSNNNSSFSSLLDPFKSSNASINSTGSSTATSTMANTNAAFLARLEHVKQRLALKKQQVQERKQQNQSLSTFLESRRNSQTILRNSFASMASGASTAASSVGGGSTDAASMAATSANGDGAADWLSVFRDPSAGLNDAEIVALCGANAMERCCRRRSKKGPQVLKMHKFDNTFFILLSKLSSIPTDFEGGFQYVDAVKGKLCLKMIPSDVTLLQDERFSKWVYLYRKNCQKFGENLTSAFAKLEDVEPVELPQAEYRAPAPAPPRLNSTASAPAANFDESEPKQQLVLLLMSPISFELVHTEVFVERARVSDVLSLIPQLASQESIRRQSYIGLCDYRNDKAIDSKMLISDVCGESTDAADVVVALPNDLFVRECARRARHILRQVIPKLKSNGTDVSHWLGNSEKPKKAQSAVF